jgi:hypothetical protein
MAASADFGMGRGNAKDRPLGFDAVTRDEIRADSGQLFGITEFMKPRVEVSRGKSQRSERAAADGNTAADTTDCRDARGALVQGEV